VIQKFGQNESYTQFVTFFYPVVSWVSSDWQRYGVIRMGSSRFGKSVCRYLMLSDTCKLDRYNFVRAIKLWMFCRYDEHGTRELRNPMGTRSHGKLLKLISCHFRTFVIEKIKIALKGGKFAVCNGYK